MSSLVVQHATGENFDAPTWLKYGLQYETVMGSTAFGAGSGSSDIDVYGFCIPPKDDVFPHLRGEIPGFSRPHVRFEQYNPHHVKSEGGVEYDFTIYSIVKYIKMCMNCNPNIIETLFTNRENHVTHCTKIAGYIRANRHVFLHKGAYDKFTGMARKQLYRMHEMYGDNQERLALVNEIGYDVKTAYHAVRLLLEIEQILDTQDIILDKYGKTYQDIRKGCWSAEYLIEWCRKKTSDLEELCQTSTLRDGPDENAVRDILLDCLEDHYGSIKDAVRRGVVVDDVVDDFRNQLAR